MNPAPPTSVEEAVAWIASDSTLGRFAFQAQDAWDRGKRKKFDEYGSRYANIYDNAIDEIDSAMKRRSIGDALREETLAHVKLHGAKLPRDVAWSRRVEETSTRRPRARKPAKPKKAVEYKTSLETRMAVAVRTAVGEALGEDGWLEVPLEAFVSAVYDAERNAEDKGSLRDDFKTPVDPGDVERARDSYLEQGASLDGVFQAFELGEYARENPADNSTTATLLQQIHDNLESMARENASVTMRENGYKGQRADETPEWGKWVAVSFETFATDELGERSSEYAVQTLGRPLTDAEANAMIKTIRDKYAPAPIVATRKRGRR